MKIKNILSRCKTDFDFINQKNITIKGLSENSKQIKENFIFFAKKGQMFNGEDFINDVSKIKNIIIVLSDNTNLNKKIKKENINKIPIIKTGEINKLIGEISSIYYESYFVETIAVTGTNGKTSVAEYTRQIWEKLNFKCSSIGTLGIIFDKKEKYHTQLTTPSSHETFKKLNEFNKKNCSHVIFEASSIGLDQDRLYPLKFDKVAFTNLSRDHLDYHLSIRNYINCKLKLFDEHTKKKSLAIINSDNLYSKHFLNLCLKKSIQVLDYGKKANFLRIDTFQDNNSIKETKMILNKKNFFFKFDVNSNFEIYNLICSLLLVFGKNLEENHFRFLKNIKNPPGRLEKVLGCKSFNIFIDYAHTPDAITNVLRALNKIKKNKIICLIGCGGGRDKGKRPLITKQALKYSDTVILADDNPRFENPSEIRDDMLKGISDNRRIKNIGNRKKAIEYGVNILEKNDILLIAGKGHESFQIIKKENKYFNDKEEALKILKKNGTLDIQ